MHVALRETIVVVLWFAAQRGGRVSYFGPLGVHSRALVEYLESVPGGWVQPRLTLGLVTSPYATPWFERSMLLLLLSSHLLRAVWQSKGSAVDCVCGVSGVLPGTPTPCNLQLHTLQPVLPLRLLNPATCVLPVVCRHHQAAAWLQPCHMDAGGHWGCHGHTDPCQH